MIRVEHIKFSHISICQSKFKSLTSKTRIPFFNPIADPALYDKTKYKVQVEIAVFYAEKYVYFRISVIVM